MQKLLRPEEVAELLQVKVKTVKDWLRSGKLRGIKTGNLWRIEQDAIDEYMNRQRVAQELELESKVQAEAADRMKEGGHYCVFGIGCEACGHSFITDFRELMEEAAKGSLPVCPECGAQVEQELITQESARQFLERQEELRGQEKTASLKAKGVKRFEPGKVKKKKQA